jgi:hypothetical protein
VRSFRATFHLFLKSKREPRKLTYVSPPPCVEKPGNISEEFDPKHKLKQLGDDKSAGLLFNVGHGFAMFVHFADTKHISSLCFMGKIEDINRQ